MQLTQTYNQASTAKTDNKGTHFNLSPELSRAPVSLHAMINNSLAYSKLMLALYKVVAGDWRTPQKDHSKYQEWVRQRYLEDLPKYYGDIKTEKLELLKKQDALLQEIKPLEDFVKNYRRRINKATGAYFNYLAKYERDKWMLFDPVISVHPDCVIFEAFSLDESSYGRVTVPKENLEIFNEVQYGTTNIDFSQALADEISRVRSYRPAWLKVAYEQVEMSTNAGAQVEKKIDLPTSWVRGFLQVQSASTMSGTTVTLSAQTLNEVLAVLHQNKAKVSPRSLRFILKKGQKPTISIDPWGTEVREFAHTYNDDFEGEIRIWGRRRLSVLEQVLPYADQVDIKLLGTGMPSYWSVSIDGHRFDLGISGWTTNDWAQKASFDFLASTGKQEKGVKEKVYKQLVAKLSGTPQDFSKWMNISKAEAKLALQSLCKEGKAMYDYVTNTYRWRQLLQEDVKLNQTPDEERFAYAFELVRKHNVRLLSNSVEDNNQVIEMEVKAKKDFKVKMTLDQDSRIKRAECTCGFFRRNKLRQGPCAHIVASTLHYSSIQDRIK